MNGNGYEVYIVVRDRDYPMDRGTENHPDHEWEAGWYGYVGLAGDHPPTVFCDYQEALALAEKLTVMR